MLRWGKGEKIRLLSWYATTGRFGKDRSRGRSRLQSASGSQSIGTPVQVVRLVCQVLEGGVLERSASLRMGRMRTLMGLVRFWLPTGMSLKTD